MDGQRQPNKRMRYFDGQILRADDFLQEQFYHIQRRQLHHRLVYALPGVVGAGGLEVIGAPNDGAVTVKAGSAINARGEELVLTEDSHLIQLPDAPVTKAEVYIVYASTDTDAPDASTQATRTTENPIFVLRKTAPASSAPSVPEGVPDRGVLLAELTLATGKLAQAPNNAVRYRVGFNLGDGTVLRLGAANSADLTGSLRVIGTALIGSSGGIMPQAPSGRVQIIGGADQAGTLRLAPDPSKGPNHSHVHWDPTGDWYIRSASGTGKVVIQDTGGNVGIGTSVPPQKLTISGAEAAPHGFGAAIGLSNTAAGGANWYLRAGATGTSTPPGGFSIADDAAYRLVVDRQGNVGIGTTTPVSKLQISGDLAVQPMAAAAARPLPPGGTLIWNDGTWLRLNQNLDFSKPTFGVHTPGVFAPLSLNVGGAGNWGDPGGGNVWINGNVGVGTTTPADKVDVAGALRILTGSNPIRFTAGWSGFPDLATNQAEISNDTGTHKTLMIVGNKSAGTGQRRVSVWDRLEVNGTLQVNGTLIAPTKVGYVVDQFVNRLGEVLEEGDVVIIGEHQTPLYHSMSDNIPILETDLADQAYDSRVCGVVAEVFAELTTPAAPRESRTSSARGNDKPAARGRPAGSRPQPEAAQVREFASEELSQRDRSKVAPGQVGFMVTMGAYAHCKVDADIASIHIGDLLTTSPTKGHAQKVLDSSKAVGTILGKALGALKKGKGKIPVLVMLE